MFLYVLPCFQMFDQTMLIIISKIFQHFYYYFISKGTFSSTMVIHIGSSSFAMELNRIQTGSVYPPPPPLPVNQPIQQYQYCILRERLFFFLDVSVYLPCIFLDFNLPRHIFKTNFYIQDLYILTSSCNIKGCGWPNVGFLFAMGCTDFARLLKKPDATVYVLKMIPFSEELVIVSSKIQ